jgi:hypothetical protein
MRTGVRTITIDLLDLDLSIGRTDQRLTGVLRHPPTSSGNAMTGLGLGHHRLGRV